MALVGPRSFKQAMKFLIPFWIVGEVALGLIREPLGDKYTGEVYVVTEKNGFPKPVPLKAKLDAYLMDGAALYGNLGTGSIRLIFSGDDLDTLKKAGIDPAFLGENTKSACSPYKSRTTKNREFFAGHDNSYDGWLTSYSYAFDLAFRNAPDTPNCHEMHVGIIDFDNIQIAVSGLNSSSFVFASLTRDSEIGFVQRMLMKLRYDRNDLPKFLSARG
ncbi:hypothetical protein [Pseudomonas putida]|uniref:hypothetical protein n=1 Tax=Pseudomonas putida TaxID=303 RepID=UPI000EF701F8|nr:hypothetical protein [Pseudomonas putida]AYN11773.1 hypothetical protein CHN49_18635 [Pseudomonas putida]